MPWLSHPERPILCPAASSNVASQPARPPAGQPQVGEGRPAPPQVGRGNQSGEAAGSLGRGWGVGFTIGWAGRRWGDKAGRGVYQSIQSKKEVGWVLILKREEGVCCLMDNSVSVIIFLTLDGQKL